MWKQLGFAVDGGWQILVVGLALGAGLPALYALGVRALAVGAEGTSPHPTARRFVGRVLGGMCFATVLIAIALGITVIVASGFGKEVTFHYGVLPGLQDRS